MTDVKRLEESLRTLRAEIEALDLRDQEARQRLDPLIRDLETALENPRREASRETLGEQLKVSILKFEASHPRLATVMNDAMQSLASMGI